MSKLTTYQKSRIETEAEARAFGVNAFYEALIECGFTTEAAREMTVSYFRGGVSAG